MADSERDYCERCGNYREGVRRWMFYSPLGSFPRPPIGREFHCVDCRRAMRRYAVIGFTLVALLVGGIVGTSLWLIWSGPSP